MLGTKGSLALGVLVVCGCGGAAKPASAPPPGEAALAVSTTPEEQPDLSPVAAPRGLFLVGRLKGPAKITQTLGTWAGLPVPLGSLLPGFAGELGDALDREAPIEAAAVLTAGGKSDPFAMVVSLGLTSLAGALEAARAANEEVVKVHPGIFRVGGPHPACAVAVALGRAPARLVCGPSQRDLETVLPFVTRGLPTLAFGSRELELELRMQPVRESYQSELAGARMLSGFLVRQLELDSPRFDRALADVVNGLTDELVMLANDVDVVALGGTVDDARGELALALDFRFGAQTSLLARSVVDATARVGAAPDALFSLPGDAEMAGYTHGFDAKRWSGAQTAVRELADAFLEHEHVGRATRERCGRLLDVYFELSGARLFSSGSSTQPPAKGKSAGTDLGWTLDLLDFPAKKLEERLADFAALLADREVRALLARRLSVPEKALPKARFVPLRAPGVVGTRALELKIPEEFYRKLSDKLPMRGKSAALPGTYVIAVHGWAAAGAVVATAPSVQELGARLGSFVSGKAPVLTNQPGARALAGLKANSAAFMTLKAVASMLSRSVAGKASGAGAAALPAAPILAHFEAGKGPPLAAHLELVVPRQAVASLPTLVSVILAPGSDPP